MSKISETFDKHKGKIAIIFGTVALATGSQAAYHEEYGQAVWPLITGYIVLKPHVLKFWQKICSVDDWDIL